jgi:SAM-dependent methyltransferase
MAVVCPIGFDAERLREEVRSIYARVAVEPEGEFHFHRGPAYAADLLGYDRDELARLPAAATASFAGVANPHRIAAIAPGSTVVDVGSGAGMDLLLAALRVGSRGRAIGIDMTEAMRARATAAAQQAGVGAWVELRDGDAESLPLDDASVDVVISNGVFNLTTDKQRAFGEVFRILKPDGRLQLGDIVVESELSEGIRSDIDLWTG